jgi:glutamine synthetase
MDVKDIQEKIKETNIDSLRIDFPDLHGICRSKLVPARRLEEVLEEGCNHVQATYAIDFANDVAMGTGAGDEIQWRDMTVKPDLDTFAVLPHLEGTARFIGNAHGPDGNRIAMDPRYVLQRILKRYEDLNLNPMAASELEFFLFNQGGEADGEVYNASPSCVYQVNPIIDPKGILRTLQNTFIELGLNIIYINHEFFPGQFEVNWKYDHALKMADQTFTFKYVCKEVAAMNDLLLTFMGRPKTDNPISCVIFSAARWPTPRVCPLFWHRPSIHIAASYWVPFARFTWPGAGTTARSTVAYRLSAVRPPA